MRSLLWLGTLLTPLLAACYSGAGEHDQAAEDWLNASEELRSGKEDRLGCSGVRISDRGPFDHQVALTFDDGPNANTTPKVMETLRRHNAPATFFINGNRVTNAKTEAIVKEIVDDPLFTLANHTWSHPNMRRISLTSAQGQIDRTTTVIEEAGGAPLYLRFPFGSSDCNTMSVVRERGLISVGWHIDSADWCFASGDGVCKKSTFPDPGLEGFRDSMSRYIMHQINKGSLQGGVLLFHDIHPSTERSLDEILISLEGQGYDFVALDETTFPKLHNAPSLPPPRSFIGDSCQDDLDCNFDGGRCGGNRLCTKRCFTVCPDKHGYPTTRCVDEEDGSSSCTLSCEASDCEVGVCTSDVEGPTGAWSVCR